MSYIIPHQYPAEQVIFLSKKNHKQDLLYLAHFHFKNA